MNGRGKSVRLCMVFALAGVLTVMCLARTSVSIPPSVSHYLDIVMAVLMVVLLLSVLELCLGVELCASSCCNHNHTTEDAEGQIEPDPSEAPPSYEVIMAQSVAGTHSGGGGGGAAARGGRGRERGRETEPLKRDISVYFKRRVREDGSGPPMRPSISPGVSETSFVSAASASELWLSVDGLPSYEEAVARLREEEVMGRLREEEVVARLWEEEAVVRLQEEVARFQEEEVMTRLREEAVAQLQEEIMARLQEEEVMARLQEEGTG